MEAILKRQAACAASQVSSHVVHWWPQEPSRDASKDCSGDLQALPPKPVLPSFNISFFLNFFNLHGTCSFPDFLALSDALKEKHLSSGVSFSLRAHHSQQASVACPHHPSFPGGRILGIWEEGSDTAFWKFAEPHGFWGLHSILCWLPCYLACPQSTDLMLRTLTDFTGVKIMHFLLSEVTIFSLQSGYRYKVAEYMMEKNWWEESETIFSEIENQIEKCRLTCTQLERDPLPADHSIIHTLKPTFPTSPLPSSTRCAFSSYCMGSTVQVGECAYLSQLTSSSLYPTSFLRFLCILIMFHI